MSDQTVLKIEHTEDLFTLHVEMSSANLIEFDIKFETGNYHEVITDICKVAPHMINLDSDLAEAYDDAFRTRPKREDQIAVGTFLQKYKGNLPDDLREWFS